MFLQQIGVPWPAEPTLLVAGSLAARGRLSIVGVIAVALAATLVADLTWYVVGKRYGARALRFVSRPSSSSEKYLRRTGRLFERLGPVAFALAKFIPGVPMAGPVLAGGMGTTLAVFVFFDLLAMAVWACTFTVLGVVFHSRVEVAFAAFNRLGGWALIIGGAIVLALTLRFVWRRVRLPRPSA